MALHEIDQSTLPCTVSAWTELSLADLLEFTQQFSTLLGANLPLARALECCIDQCSSPAFRELLTHLTRRVQGGSSLSIAMVGFPTAFSPVYIAMVKAGEESGRLQPMFDSLVVLLEKKNQLALKVRSLLMYPAFVVFTSLLVCAVVIGYVLPRTLALCEANQVPLPTICLRTLQLAQLFSHPAVFVILGLSMVGLYRWCKPWFRRQQRINQSFDELISGVPLKIPLIGKILRRQAAAQLLATLACLIEAGLPLFACLQLCAKVSGNAVFASQLKNALSEISAGASLSESLSNCDLFPPAAIHMIAVGEESPSQMPILMRYTARLFEEDAQLAIEGLIAFVEPTLFLLIGLLVGFLVLITMAPVVSLIQHL